MATATFVQAQQPGKTVKLLAYKPDGRSDIGTAFLIDQQGTAVTCYHVIMNAYRIDAFPTKSRAYNVDLIDVDPLHDLAEVRIPGLQHTMAFALKTHITPPLTKLHLKVLGFLNGDPDGEIRVTATDKMFLKSGDLEDQGSKIFAVSDVDIIPLDSLGYHGLSGSPLIDEITEEVIGVFEGSISQGGAQTWAIPVSYLRYPAPSPVIAMRTFTWPPMQLIKDQEVKRYTRSLQLPSGFEKSLSDSEAAVAKYNDLLARMNKVFDDCRAKSKRWNDLTQTLPDGVSLPLHREDAPDIAIFEEQYRLASDGRQRACGEALRFYHEIVDIQGSAKTYVTKARDNLTEVVKSNAPRQLPIGLIAETQSITEGINRELGESDSLWKSVSNALKQAQSESDPVPSDTNALKIQNRRYADLDETVISDDVRHAVRLDLDVITEYLTLTSDTISYLSGIDH